MVLRGSRWSRRAHSLRAAGATPELRECLGPLWPDSTLIDAGTAGGTEAGRARADRWIPLPGRQRITMVVPAGARKVAAATVAQHRHPNGRVARAKHAAVVLSISRGLLRWVPGGFVVPPAAAGPDLAERLGALTGRTVGFGIHLGPPRANRKPILQVVDAGGETVAYAKVGVNDLTATLVARETEALTSLATRLPVDVRIPPVLAAFDWAGHPMLVLEPVPTSSATATDPQRLQRAMVAVSRSHDVTSRRLEASTFWARLSGAIAALGDSQDGPGLAALADRIQSAYGADAIDFGCWHGDWTPWNSCHDGDDIVVWDWERFDADVPLGFDALHYDMQRGIRRGGVAPRVAAAATLASAATLLAPFAVGEQSVRRTCALYLLEIGTRYAADGQRRAGARLGDLEAWLLPELASLLPAGPAPRSGSAG